MDKQPKQIQQKIVPPGLVKKLGNYAKAYWKHKLAGRPESTREEIANRLEICQGCEAYMCGSCAVCGCYINTNLASEGKNKLAWADSECPWLNLTTGEHEPKWNKIER